MDEYIQKYIEKTKLTNHGICVGFQYNRVGPSEYLRGTALMLWTLWILFGCLTWLYWEANLWLTSTKYEELYDTYPFMDHSSVMSKGLV